MEIARKASVAGKASVQFRERSELLDFLLEVSAAAGATLDLDQLFVNIAEIVRKVMPYDLFAILLYNENRGDLGPGWHLTWRICIPRPCAPG
jgi:hypothetical protein